MILITGSAGFIGFSLANSFLSSNMNVIGIDKLNSDRTNKIKRDRLKILKKNKNFIFKNIDITNYNIVKKIFLKYNINTVIHLAALAGVRESINNPSNYFNSNLSGFFNIIEISRKNKVKKFIYASSSSVYSKDAKVPYDENSITNNQISFYAFTKKTNEEIAKFYSQNYGLTTIGLRFFSIYGPWGRPDMAYYKFTHKIFNNEKIDVYNFGNHKRDFTFIDDVIFFIRLICKSSSIKLKKDYIFNVGNSNPIKLTYLIKLIESYLGKKAKIRMLKKQIGDVDVTYANMQNVEKKLQFRTEVSIEDGMKRFIDWFIDYHR